MYESFYGFTEKPFSLLPDPSFLYLGKKHSMAFTMLQYGVVSQAGFTVIAGEIGCGKTTLIRHLLNNLERDVTVGLISNTQHRIGELMQWVLLAFGLEYRSKEKVELYETFVNFVIDEYGKQRRTVLILDEAQNMDAQTMEELRMLSNINSDKDLVLQIILVGQPELRALLRRPELEQFAQRIAADYYLEPLSAQETTDYIHHRLTVAGGDSSMFSAEACELVYRYTRGVPRLINALCDNALVYGFAEQKKVIDAVIVRDVVHDRSERTVLSDSTQQRKNQIGVVNTVAKVGPTKPVEAPEVSLDAARQLFSGLRNKKR
ncbi:MAG: AAA family ATPase [Gammaproteobacteria bacterium]|jgi:putative secretion ATPase (PEP-CTERM system associated)